MFSSPHRVTRPSCGKYFSNPELGISKTPPGSPPHLSQPAPAKPPTFQLPGRTGVERGGQTGNKEPGSQPHSRRTDSESVAGGAGAEPAFLENLIIRQSKYKPALIPGQMGKLEPQDSDLGPPGPSQTMEHSRHPLGPLSWPGSPPEFLTHTSEPSAGSALPP